jgi:hypothetical protein
MKKFVAMLLVLTMVIALACTTAMAASRLEGKFVVLTEDSNAYTAAKSSKKTASVAKEGSHGYCVDTCGKYAKVIVNAADGTYAWFKKCNLVVVDIDTILFVWAKGGKGMSCCMKNSIDTDKALFHGKIKVTGHTNLRKNPGMKFKSQGVVEKCDKLKLTGRYGYDNRPIAWLEVCKDGKKLWVSTMFVELSEAMVDFLYYDI